MRGVAACLLPLASYDSTADESRLEYKKNQKVNAFYEKSVDSNFVQVEEIKKTRRDLSIPLLNSFGRGFDQLGVSRYCPLLSVAVRCCPLLSVTFRYFLLLYVFYRYVSSRQVLVAFCHCS